MYAALVDFVMECFATFLFVIVFGMTYDESMLVVGLAVGIGASLLVASEKADLNPVVSIAIALCDSAMGWSQLTIRVLAQIVGAILGGLVSIAVWRRDTLDFSHYATATVTKALVFEIVFSCFLVLVVLRTRESGLGAFTHGLCYTVAIFCALKVFNGNAMINPATALGLMTGSNALNRTTDESYVWLYLVGPFIGALIAVVFYQLTEYLDDEEEDTELDETTEYVRTTVVKQVEQPKPSPQVTHQPVTNAYVQPVDVNERGQEVDSYQGANNYQGAYRTEGYQVPQSGNTMYSTKTANSGGQSTMYTSNPGVQNTMYTANPSVQNTMYTANPGRQNTMYTANQGGQNRYVQPQNLN